MLLVEEKIGERWREAHNAAIKHPRGVEIAIIGLLSGLEGYRRIHEERFGMPVEEDILLAQRGIVPMVRGIRELLHMEHGRLDAATIDRYLAGILKACEGANEYVRP